VTKSESPGSPRLGRTPIVIAPDVILDLIGPRSERRYEAAMLFDAIAADVEAGNDQRPAYIAPVTVPLIHYLAREGGDARQALGVTVDLLRLLHVAQLANEDYAEAALQFHNFAYEDAIQFVTCRRVAAKYLVTSADYGVLRMPVRSRTAAEVVGWFGTG
jgi:hypothetical protein